MNATQKSSGVTTPRHFYSLDALRGLAALSIVFFHWRHFFNNGTELVGFDESRQPFYSIFSFLYVQGDRAVDLFFCLSGFVFFWLYAGKIERCEVSLKEFSLLRFSRLYPLHFVTLLGVGIAQHMMFWKQGSYFVYTNNDLYHFILQLLFMSNWGFEKGASFNAPIWSVSVEIILYIVFFLVCRLNLSRWKGLLCYVFLGILLSKTPLSPVARGVVAFFAGGLAYTLFTHVLRNDISKLKMQITTALTALMWVIIPMNESHQFIYSIYRDWLWSERLNWMGKDIFGSILSSISAFAYSLILFPLTIITLAFWETKRGTLGKRLSFLGRVSYSSYLLGFPLQMAFASIAIWNGWPNTIFYHPWSLILFFAVLIPASLLSYHFLERPCQLFLRKKFRV